MTRAVVLTGRQRCSAAATRAYPCPNLWSTQSSSSRTNRSLYASDDSISRLEAAIASATSGRGGET
eukprot:CAMPEP_0173412476 /NCGR_PEP_ID=MMETSP1356-20130122/79602_1 /TAXON_ID=77927 ORGANISM="Hemiselmis virescens, Strain PCC157" /NCGR_SAMPLE_ID=MMETSP1356 /ASSEMBLY_ACC=CAM_ASM_000847 /LENGTH=65 /DNA_ID=CAMNT_0014374381 /DNA_START=269 /DNA_END=466 /DNA_ORIENTATION=-